MRTALTDRRGAERDNSSSVIFVLLFLPLQKKRKLDRQTLQTDRRRRGSVGGCQGWGSVGGASGECKEVWGKFVAVCEILHASSINEKRTTNLLLHLVTSFHNVIFFNEVIDCQRFLF